MDQKEYEAKEWLYETVRLTKLWCENDSLEPVELYDCEIIGARLSKSTLKRWVFENCTFKDSDLSNLNFESCVFDHCHFEACRLIGSQFIQSSDKKQQISFKDCDLSLSNLSQMNLEGVSFSHCNCSDVDFSYSNLTMAQFIETQVHQALFENSNLSEAELSGALGEQFDPSLNQMTNATVTISTAIRLVENLGLKVRQ
ncbi:MAG: hypothetical protein CMH49_10135 [Myxococcales bacterium]|nr:hypothetical protein [Myxococcales bacterium]